MRLVERRKKGQMNDGSSSPATNVEARKMVAGALGIINVLIDDEGSSPGVVLVPKPDLPDGAVLAKDIIHFLTGDLEWQVPASSPKTENEKKVFKKRKRPPVAPPEDPSLNIQFRIGHGELEKKKNIHLEVRSKKGQHPASEYREIHSQMGI